MDDSHFLSELAEKLRTIRRRKLATQECMERSTGVGQETISKVLHGRRRRRSEQLERLNQYADMLLNEHAFPTSVKTAVNEFLAFGTEDELVASIKLCAGLVARRPVE